jgi:hypothetical protein
MILVWLSLAIVDKRQPQNGSAIARRHTSTRFPKFVTRRSTRFANFGKQRVLATYDSSTAIDLKSLDEIAATDTGTSNRRY